MFIATDQPKSLNEALATKGVAKSRLATRCGVTRAAVSQWCSGGVRPSGPSRLAISRALRTKIDVVNSWFPERVAA